MANEPRTRLKPAQRDRLADQAHDAIRTAIVTGGFALGERLIETQLAADLEMSRAPVREALAQLTKEGLVTENPHSGTFVTTLSAADVVDFYNVRLGLETTAIRLFMHRDESTDALRAQVEAMAEAAEAGDVSTVARAELEFHRLICEGAGNSLLLRLFREQQDRLMLVMALDDAGFERLHDVAAEHVPVIDAIEAGDAMAAVATMEEHVLSTVSDLIERLDGNTAQLLAPLPVTARRRRTSVNRSR